MDQNCVSQPLVDEDYTQLASVFKLLADPQRLTIVATLARAAAPVCVCDFTSVLPLNQPAVSHHLKLLRDGGLVTTERRGTWIYYSLAKDAISRIRAATTIILAEGISA